MQIGLILVVLAFPLLELAVLIKVGQTIGFWWTVLLLMATGLAGGALVQQQGMSAARRTLQSMGEGRPPIEPVVDSMMLVLAGFLLLLPGFLTDVMGLALLVPPLRRMFARWAFRRIFSGGGVRVETREWRSPSHPAADSGQRPPDQDGSRRPPAAGPVIEGEWERIDDPHNGGRPRPGDSDRR